MPLAAVVQGKILCVHSGIGATIQSVADIENLPRPIEVIQEPTNSQQQVLVDLLWSDPTENENEHEISQNKPNYGMKNVIKYGMNRLKNFLNQNNLTLLIRSHECVEAGFEQSSKGPVLTIFSCTDYCGKFTNAASVGVIKKNFELVPKVIYPQGKNEYTYREEEKENTEPKGSGTASIQHKMSFQNSWIDTEESLKKRPATPPRLNSSINNTNNKGNQALKKKL